MDFIKIKERMKQNGVIQVYPDFIIGRVKDLMVRGQSFYAIWDETKHLWSVDEYDVQRLVDKEINEYINKNNLKERGMVQPLYLSENSSGIWKTFKAYTKSLADNYHPLDRTIIFQNQETDRTSYASRKLPYDIIDSEIPAYNEIISTLYEEKEREKLEWAIGSVIAGDSKNIQKFIVLFGDPGSGKGTILDIMQRLFAGYYSTFEADALTAMGNVFAMESFKDNPLLAINADGDLSRIEINARLNSIVSHELMTMNEKFKSPYSMKIDTFLIMATNKPVKITDAKSGILRRLIDVHPSGNLVPVKRYNKLMRDIDYELGGIASRCLDVYKSLGKHHYQSYRPVDMMMRTNAMFNFVEENFYDYKKNDGVTLAKAWEEYKEFCDNGLLQFKLSKYVFRDELRNYFTEFWPRYSRDNDVFFNYYRGFRADKFNGVIEQETEEHSDVWLALDYSSSVLDSDYSGCPAQYSKDNGRGPLTTWDSCKTTLKDLVTSKEHFVRFPKNLICIDFDIKNKEGEKDLELNLLAAKEYPRTYAEVSKSGQGLHLYYIYDGDVTKLCPVISDGIETKVCTGKQAIRRRVSRCNNLSVAHISSGLPLKEEKTMILTDKRIEDERHLRNLIKKGLNRQVFPNTKPSVDYIKMVVEEAYNSKISYDISDMYEKLLNFALESHHQKDECVDIVNNIPLYSEFDNPFHNYDGESIVFFDIEIFPNLFIICWKIDGKGNPVVKMINPKPDEVKQLFQFKLVGFNNRNYDNHMIYAASIGYSIYELYLLSQRIIKGGKGSKQTHFPQAYNLSYCDAYDMLSSSNRKGLKKYEIEMGIHHQENAYDWDKPVGKEHWLEIADYCANDVIATEAVFYYKHADFEAREMLAAIAGGTVNDSTNSLTQKFIVGDDMDKSYLRYVDLSEEFPGYTFNDGVSMYKGEEVGEGGYVYAVHGVHFNVKTYDVSGMHPSSIIAMNLFGKYTERFRQIVEARTYIKHGDYAAAGELFGGVLKSYLTDPKQAKAVSNALKTAVNSVYGLTFASFPNAFKDDRNVDNIVAKRGALFMVNLKEEVTKRGYKVVHIKTDSIKVVNPDKEIEDFIYEYGRQYGYNFEVESEYERMCLVNNAVYIARTKDGVWTATGKQFDVPYVFKSLFSHEPIADRDLTEVINVSTKLYLDMNEGYPDVTNEEKQLAKLRKKDQTDAILEEEKRLEEVIKKGHNYVFVGSIGSFVPIKEGYHGGSLVCERDGKMVSAPGAKGYYWLEEETVSNNNLWEFVDMSYFNKKKEAAYALIVSFGFDFFDERKNKEPVPDFMNVPEGEEELPFD